ncbi:hypothetical protein [Limnoglobus roseus]|uniref:SMI1/KNR4 family protein n=1 Tax=Limnoglobus roseus TaxID=2598579 RepID=A0A5C1ADX4_9BACT|nr:hypothetical protein [Limnoglobus roseus]QEL16910.1 hypothetical protein PX52LOC_03885 [Limnoglobus roseus]
MTEQEWSISADPTRMLEFLKATASDRKLRLFASACCDRVLRARGANGDLADAEDYLTALDREADRIGSPEEWDAAIERVLGKRWEITDRTLDALEADFCAFLCALDNDPYPAAVYASVNANIALSAFPRRPEVNEVGGSLEAVVQAGLLRDIFGDPFRSPFFDAAWVSSTARSLAEAAYEDRAWDRLPILADALEDAGCEEAAVLTHLRGPGPHCRGCWVVDLVLGKE